MRASGNTVQHGLGWQYNLGSEDTKVLMDGEPKQFLEGMEARLAARIDASNQRTADAMKALEGRLILSFDSLAALMKKLIDASNQRTDDALKALEERLILSFDSLAALMKKLIDALEQRTDDALKTLEERLVEHLRDFENSLLTEFHKWASPIETRVRSHTGVLHATDAEVEWLKDRLKKIENRPTGT